MPAKILVVDDEPHLEIVILQAFRQEIKAGELSFLFARNGGEALKALEKSPDIDIVLSDINMPEMSGLTLLKRLTEEHPLIKTIIVTAYGDMANIRAAMNHGAFDFLNKPINFSDLKITLKKTIEQVWQVKELQREREQRYLAEKLHTLTETLNRTLNTTEVLKRFMVNLSQVVSYERALVCILKDDDLLIADFDGHEDSFPSKMKAALKLMMERAMLARAPIALSSGTSEEDALDEEAFGVNRTVLCLPLISKESVLGMAVVDRRADSPFSEHERKGAYTLTGNAAFAIENASLFEEVRRLATTDGLTGLYNRRHFMELSHKEVTRSKRYGNPLAAIMLDIDHFKEFNDNYGHSAGDQALKRVADALSRECRQTDILGRYGGDELVVLLIETDLKLGREIAERLREAIEGEAIELADGAKAPITVSMGLATLDLKTQDLERLIQCADARLYAAKQKGRNRLEYA